MGSVISTVAFPAPDVPRSYYEQGLLRRDDLLWLTTSANERIPAIYKRYGNRNYEHPRGGGEQRRPTIIYSHGNAEDIGLHLPFVDCLSEMTGCDVLSYEYVGYSLSRLNGDEPSEGGCIRSIDAAWRFLVDTERVPPSYIIIYGRSIGTGPSVDIASRSKVPKSNGSPHDVGGVFLQSPLESGARATLGAAVSCVGYHFDIFRNYEKIDKIKAPVAIVHGENDQVVPCENGRNLHKKAKDPFAPYWMVGKGHNDMPERDVCLYCKNFANATIKKSSAQRIQ
uniref:Serine aminopeptidase S33 domain-containing protein n=1 Tax=Helicotheca tamesis TaxID=374047 RepID=A0A7S2E2G7_9STRA|eukprot:CAMPEP_0185724294 /NCGR_PEP_ID=MMETSP1171-20130828/819_1 /TAXON_ID=374046 /ORGANISM="Helicotheca tamensis, Strain CCMP826" /LENGTH=281 /DNA_ID=CAMNT_0028392111 /DNA_START=84 /DNA_END=929 /DNA_ORIENTATION=+